MYPAAMWAFDFHWPQRAGDDEVALDVTQRLAEVVQPSGSLVIVREPSALTLIVPAPARFSCS